MSQPPIQNALLRVNGAKEEPTFPFERPRADMDFSVLELPCLQGDDVAGWCSCTAEVLIRHSKLLSQLVGAGKRLTLFIEIAPGELVALEAQFLKVLADRGISIEAYVQPANV